MPLILEKRERSTAHQQPSQRRLSGIPRPLKHLTVENNASGISHASKPTIDTLPTISPSKGVIRIANSTGNPNNGISQDASKKSHVQKTLFKMDNDPEVTILELVPFSRQPTVDFGNVNIGSTRIRCIILRNSSDKQQQMRVMAFPKADRGFYIDATEFLIAPRTEICVDLAWTPKVPGGIRESITLHDINRMRWRIVLSGTGSAPKPQLPFQNRNAQATIPRLFRRPSPSKLNRKMISERNKLLFSPQSRQSTAKSQKRVVKPLTKLRTPSPSKRSQLVKKILSKRDNEMATRIQSYCRRFLVMKDIERRKKFTLVLQSTVRGFLARRNLQLKKQAAIVLQSHWRAHKVRQEYKRTKAAVLIQSMWRTQIAMRKLAHLKQINKSVILLQSIARGFLARRDLQRKRRAAIVLQFHWRAHKVRQERKRTRAAILIQSMWRVQIAKRKLARLKQVKRSVILLQSNARGFLTRRDLQRKRLAAIVLQSHWRAYKVRGEYRRIKAAIMVQTMWRAQIAKRKLTRLRQVNKSVVLLQSIARGFLARRDLQRKKLAAIVLQSYWRAYKVRQEYKRIKAAIMIQSMWRTQIAKRKLARLKQVKRSVILLQSNARGYLVRRKLKRSIEAILKIQLQSFRDILVSNKI